MLKTIFVTFDSTVTRRGVDATAQGVWTSSTWLYNPQAGKALTNDADALEWQVVIDSRVWPVWPVRSISDTWYHLRQALDQNRYGTSNISAADFQKDKFVIAIDVEKGASTIDGASFSGHPCRSGSPITVKFRNFPDASVKSKVAFIHLCHDVIINVTAAGVESLE
jgi:hypothetical protein